MDVIEVTRKNTKFYRTSTVLVGVTVDLCQVNQVKGDVGVILVMLESCDSLNQQYIYIYAVDINHI